MRKVSQSEYETAKAALAVYAEHCNAFVQKNGWTCIPAGVESPEFEGAKLDTDAVNAFSTAVELFELATEKPAKFSAYISTAAVASPVTTWTGEVVGRVLGLGAWHTNNMGGRWRSIWIETDWKDARGFNTEYHGREYDSRNLVNFTKTVKRED